MTKILEDKVETSVRQIREAWRLMSRDAPGRREAFVDGIDYIFTGLPIPFFNVAVLTEPSISASALKSSADAARAWAGETGEAPPWFLIVTHEALEPGVDASAILGECGLAAALPLTGMLADRIPAVDGVPEGLRLDTTITDADCAAVLDINSAAYEMDLGSSKPVLGRQAFWNDHVAALGRVDGGTAVSSAAVMMVDGYRYVALVATDPGHRRRGYAEAVMRHALQSAAATYGEVPSVLHATDAGRPIYARMGYDTISTHTLFMDAAMLHGH